jgi:hypothetical protein
MTTVGSPTAAPAQSLIAQQAAGREIASSSVTSSPSGAADTESATVSISGRTMMLSRLFGATDPSANPAIYQPGTAPSSGLIYSFLTSSDRDVVSSLYEYAQANSIDPVNVDHFAFDLGCYRATPNLSDSVGQMFDSQTGEPLNLEFKNPGDEAIAQRILTSKAISDTQIPHDFLRAQLDPGIKGGHAVDFAFLERIVYASSASGSDGAQDPNAVLAPRPKERLAKLEAAGTLPSPEQMRASTSSDSGTVFDKYAGRIHMLAQFLPDDVKGMLGALYATAEAKGSGPNSPEMTTVDRLARDLAVRAMTTAILLPNTAEQHHTGATALAQPVAHQASTYRSRLDLRA